MQNKKVWEYPVTQNWFKSFNFNEPICNTDVEDLQNLLIGEYLFDITMNYSFIIECPSECNGMAANNTIKHPPSLEFFRKKFSG